MTPILKRVEPIVGITLLVFIAVGCFVVLRPFITSLMLAAILSFATWPVFIYLKERLGFGHVTAALLMSVLLATALILPLVLVGTSLVDDARRLIDLLIAAKLPPPPDWVSSLPWFGEWLSWRWQVAIVSEAELLDTVRPYLRNLRDLALTAGASMARGIFELSVCLIVMFFFYRDGEAAAKRIIALNARIFGPRAEQLQAVVTGTIRSVIYGVVGTAIVQGALAAVGYLIAGLPTALLLGFVTFAVALLPPLGPPLIWVPASLWLFNEGSTGLGIFMAVYGFFVISGADNIVRPYLISQGSQLPLIIVFLGLFGGLAAFGFLGIFLGPTLLALGFVLVREMSAGRGPSLKIDAGEERA